MIRGPRILEPIPENFEAKEQDVTMQRAEPWSSYLQGLQGKR